METYEVETHEKASKPEVETKMAQQMAEMKRQLLFPRFEAAMVSPTGRLGRILLGVAMIKIGLSSTSTRGRTLGAFGVVPLAAGLFDLCILGPILGGSIKGTTMRRMLAEEDISKSLAGKSQVKSIHMNELHNIQQEDGSGDLIIDVRDSSAYAEGHVPHAINLSHEEIEKSPKAHARALSEYDRVFVYCREGNRSKKVAETLHGAGLKNITYVSNSGMPDWKERGFEQERGHSVV